MLLKDVRAHPNIIRCEYVGFRLFFWSSRYSLPSPAMVALSSRMHETFKDKLHFYVVFEPLPKLFHFEIGRAFSHFVSTPEVCSYVKVSESLTTSWKPRLTLSRRFPPFLLVNNQQLSGSLLFLSLKQPGNGSRSATGRSATAPGLFVQPPSTAGVLKKPFPFSPGRWTTCTVA